jgi:hypothetical protein
MQSPVVDPDATQKRAVIRAYAAPLPATRVICLDEWCPIAAQTYPGAE